MSAVKRELEQESARQITIRLTDEESRMLARVQADMAQDTPRESVSAAEVFRRLLRGAHEGTHKVRQIDG